MSSARGRSRRTGVDATSPSTDLGALLQFDFDAMERKEAHGVRPQKAEKPASIRDAIVRWLDEQL